VSWVWKNLPWPHGYNLKPEDFEEEGSDYEEEYRLDREVFERLASQGLSPFTLADDAELNTPEGQVIDATFPAWDWKKDEVLVANYGHHKVTPESRSGTGPTVTTPILTVIPASEHHEEAKVVLVFTLNLEQWWVKGEGIRLRPTNFDVQIRALGEKANDKEWAKASLLPIYSENENKNAETSWEWFLEINHKQPETPVLRDALVWSRPPRLGVLNWTGKLMG